MKTEKEFEFVAGQCERCENIRIYQFSDNRCLENCEDCDATLTMIHRFNLEVGA